MVKDIKAHAQPPFLWARCWYILLFFIFYFSQWKQLVLLKKSSSIPLLELSTSLNCYNASFFPFWFLFRLTNSPLSTFESSIVCSRITFLHPWPNTFISNKSSFTCLLDCKVIFPHIVQFSWHCTKIVNLS